jgi:hypothetical protein
MTKSVSDWQNDPLVDKVVELCWDVFFRFGINYPLLEKDREEISTNSLSLELLGAS